MWSPLYIILKSLLNGPKTDRTARVLNCIKKNKVKKECYLIRQYNIQIFYKIIFFNYRTRQIKTTETNKKVTYDFVF